jgi:hypothetical protein
MNLLKNIKITTLYSGDTAEAASNIDSTVRVDMLGYDGCLVVCRFDHRRL